MPHQQVELRQAGDYGVVGELSFDTVMYVEKEGMAAIDESTSPILFDLSAVTKCSSASLALLISWKRYAENSGKSLQVVRVPESLAGQIKSACLESVFPIDA
ncbi:hypothetical protein NBRC116188_06600 [Oceaniserpentilla sp. 4NH20-0058]|uniref:STAS domain-containing protein n=1 Tax=Oceaniserpentilla sp. 4NH20-0058 TaxID=3127660 RepID=UPI0031056393